MTEIILVRHGQANSHATDAASYDRLSDLGQAQARWLGEHLGTTNAHFDHVITGSLLRHVQTAEAMGYPPATQDPRLNELDYWALAHALERATGIARPQSPDAFATHFPQTMRHWSEGALSECPESFDAFTDRVGAALAEIAALHGRVLVVTSGGVIGIALRHVLGLGIDATSRVVLQTWNSSLHRLDHVREALHLSTFNAIPHLDPPERAHARTFV